MDNPPLWLAVLVGTAIGVALALALCHLINRVQFPTPPHHLPPEAPPPKTPEPR